MANTTLGVTKRNPEYANYSTQMPLQESRFTRWWKSARARIKFYRLRKRPLTKEWGRPTREGLTHTEQERVNAEIRAKDNLMAKYQEKKRLKEEMLLLQEQERIRLAEQKRLRGRR